MKSFCRTGRDRIMEDKLLATTLMKINVLLDERYELLFNGESPRNTRIWATRVCLPIVSFHHLENSQDTSELTRLLKDRNELVHWNDIWKIYQEPDIESFLTQPIRIDEDHVGGIDSSSIRLQHIQDPETCLKACNIHKTCIAWTWFSKDRTCSISPWMVVGRRSRGKFSGVHAMRVGNRLARCSR